MISRGELLGIAGAPAGLWSVFVAVSSRLLPAKCSVSVLGRVMGDALRADSVAEGTAPVMVGYVRDWLGSDGAGFPLLVAMALGGAFAIAQGSERRADVDPGVIATYAHR